MRLVYGQILDILSLSGQFFIHDHIEWLTVTEQPDNIGGVWVNLCSYEDFLFYFIGLADEVENGAEVAEFDLSLFENADRSIMIILENFTQF